MRGTSNDQSIYRREDGTIVGVGLGFDFTAEHEWGIAGIQDKFGIPDGKQPQGGWGDIVNFIFDLPIGPEKYIITRGEVYPIEITKEITNYNPKPDKKGKVKRFTKTNTTFYGITSKPIENPRDIEWQTQECGFSYREEADKRVYSAWDSKDFVFMLEDKALRDEILEAFKRKDIIIFLGASPNPFSRSNFNIIIKSRMPQEAIDVMTKADLSARKLMKAFKAAGIELELKKANCKYFCLSPKWVDDKEEALRYWLNPYEQDKIEANWYTLEDLKDWAKGTGKVFKTKVKA